MDNDSVIELLNHILYQLEIKKYNSNYSEHRAFNRGIDEAKELIEKEIKKL